ncbi:MAG: biotin/lipoyl-containing protein, partial [Kangiellaceae bacterium]
MTDLTQVKVPDIGDAEGAEIIEVLVSVGDEIEKESPLIVLETDKATMEVPSSHAGKVASINVKVGEQVSQDDLILEVSTEAGSAETTSSESVANMADSNQDNEQAEAETLATEEPSASQMV